MDVGFIPWCIVSKSKTNLDEFLLRNRFVYDCSECRDRADAAELDSAISSVCLGEVQINVYKVFITDNCNLDCDYCLIEQNLLAEKARRVGGMTLESCNELIDRIRAHCEGAHRSQNRTIMLYGGEPLMNFQAVEQIVAGIRSIEKELDDQRFEIVLETNGTLVTEQIARYLAREKVAALVSLDGTKECHDSRRKTRFGTGSWEMAIRGVETLRDAGVSVGISTVFTPEIAPEAGVNIVRLSKALGIRSFGLNLFHLAKTAKGKDLIIDEHISDYVRAWRYCRLAGIYIEHVARRIRPLVEGRLRPRDCTACGGRAVVTPDGKLGICEALIGESSAFREMSFLDAEEDALFREWSTRTPLLWDDCRQCIALGLCGGGCAYNALFETGTIHAPDRYICAQSKALVIESLKILSSEHIDLWKATANDRFPILLSKAQKEILYGEVPERPMVPLQYLSRQQEHQSTDVV